MSQAIAASQGNTSIAFKTKSDTVSEMTENQFLWFEKELKSCDKENDQAKVEKILRCQAIFADFCGIGINGHYVVEDARRAMAGIEAWAQEFGLSLAVSSSTDEDSSESAYKAARKDRHATAQTPQAVVSNEEIVRLADMIVNGAGDFNQSARNVAEEHVHASERLHFLTKMATVCTNEQVRQRAVGKLRGKKGLSDQRFQALAADVIATLRSQGLWQ